MSGTHLGPMALATCSQRTWPERLQQVGQGLMACNARAEALLACRWWGGHNQHRERKGHVRPAAGACFATCPAAVLPARWVGSWEGSAGFRPRPSAPSQCSLPVDKDLSPMELLPWGLLCRCGRQALGWAAVQAGGHQCGVVGGVGGAGSRGEGVACEGRKVRARGV